MKEFINDLVNPISAHASFLSASKHTSRTAAERNSTKASASFGGNDMSSGDVLQTSALLCTESVGKYFFAGNDLSLENVTTKTATHQEEREQGLRLLSSSGLSLDALSMKKRAGS
jgi:hypothetical protein